VGASIHALEFGFDMDSDRWFLHYLLLVGNVTSPVQRRPLAVTEGDLLDPGDVFAFYFDQFGAGGLQHVLIQHAYAHAHVALDGCSVAARAGGSGYLVVSSRCSA